MLLLTTQSRGEEIDLPHTERQLEKQEKKLAVQQS